MRSIPATSMGNALESQTSIGMHAFGTMKTATSSSKTSRAHMSFTTGSSASRTTTPVESISVKTLADKVRLRARIVTKNASKTDSTKPCVHKTKEISSLIAYSKINVMALSQKTGTIAIGRTTTLKIARGEL